MKVFNLLGGVALACLFGCAGSTAQAGSINGMLQSAICDPYTNGGKNCIKPNADGSINVNGGGGVGSDVNITGLNGSAPDTGSGASSAQTLRTIPATDTPIPVGAATAANQNTANGYLGTIAGAVGSSQPAACTGVIPISQTSSTDLKTMTNKGQICSIVLVAPDAEVVSLVQGTGTTCATGIAALIGGTTAANGISLAANGGFTATSSAPWLVMTSSAQHLCLLQSGSGRVAGVITYVDK